MAGMHLLRIKCESRPQGDFLKKEGDSQDIIYRAFHEKPTAIVTRQSEWHIGNVEDFANNAVSFAMGRTMEVSAPRFDSARHDFLDEDTERAPYTIGVYDIKTQVCGILRRPGVSQKVTEISHKLGLLLNSAKVTDAYNSEIVVDPIFDPEPFLDQLRAASSIEKFTFYVTRPNPFDVDRLIQKPVEEYTEKLNGTRTKVETEGDDLDEEVAEEVAKAAAAKGDDASATIRLEGKKTKRIFLKGTPVTEDVQASVDESLFVTMLEVARRAYDRVRHSKSA